MNQMVPIIYVKEGNVHTPYIVLERLSEFANPKLSEGCRLIREQLRGQPPALLLCRPIADIEYTDISTESETEVLLEIPKKGQSDTTA